MTEHPSTMALLINSQRRATPTSLAAEQLHIRNRKSFEELILHYLGAAWRDEWARASRLASESHQNAVEPAMINDCIAQKAASAFLTEHGPTIWPDLISERRHLAYSSSVEWKFSSKYDSRSGPVFSIHGKMTRIQYDEWVRKLRTGEAVESRIVLGSPIGQVAFACMEVLLQYGERGRQRSEQEVERLVRAVVADQSRSDHSTDETQIDAFIPHPVAPAIAPQACGKPPDPCYTTAVASLYPIEELHIKNREPFEALALNYLSDAAAHQPSEEELELLNAYDGSEITASEYVAVEATYNFLITHGQALWPHALSQRFHLTTWSRKMWQLPIFLQNSSVKYAQGPVWDLHGMMTNRERSVWKGNSGQWPTEREMVVESKIGKVVEAYMLRMYRELDAPRRSYGQNNDLIRAVLASGDMRQGGNVFFENEWAALQQWAAESTLTTNPKAGTSSNTPIDLTESDRERAAAVFDSTPAASTETAAVGLDMVDPLYNLLRPLIEHPVHAHPFSLEGGPMPPQYEGGGAKWPCPVPACPYNYCSSFNEQALRHHVHTNHPERAKKPYFRCPLANCPTPEVFMQEQELQRHQERFHGCRANLADDFIGGEGAGGPVGQHKRVIEIVEGENGRSRKRRRDNGYQLGPFASSLTAKQSVEQAMKETGGLGGLPFVRANY